MDRNVEEYLHAGGLNRSLSARRAWIEIGISALKQIPWTVALRKESVDRNLLRDCRDSVFEVALRKESVDRNYKERPGQKARPSRSPQGERG